MKRRYRCAVAGSAARSASATAGPGAPVAASPAAATSSRNLFRRFTAYPGTATAAAAAATSATAAARVARRTLRFPSGDEVKTGASLPRRPLPPGRARRCRGLSPPAPSRGGALRLPRQLRLRRRGAALAVQGAPRRGAPPPGRRARLPLPLSDLVGGLRRLARSLLRLSLRRRPEGHSGAARLGQPDGDRLLGRPCAVLAPSNVLESPRARTRRRRSSGSFPAGGPSSPCPPSSSAACATPTESYVRRRASGKRVRRLHSTTERLAVEPDAPSIMSVMASFRLCVRVSRAVSSRRIALRHLPERPGGDAEGHDQDGDAERLGAPAREPRPEDEEREHGGEAEARHDVGDLVERLHPVEQPKRPADGRVRRGEREPERGGRGHGPEQDEGRRGRRDEQGEHRDGAPAPFRETDEPERRRARDREPPRHPERARVRGEGGPRAVYVTRVHGRARKISGRPRRDRLSTRSFTCAERLSALSPPFLGPPRHRESASP